jgi:predicted PurR-regulated permease PerM
MKTVPQDHTSISTRSFAYWVIILLGGGTLLYLGRSLFIPLAFSVLISFVLYPMCRWLEKKGVNRVLAIVILLIALTMLLAAVLSLLVSQFMAFGEEWPRLRDKLEESYSQLGLYMENKWSVGKEARENFIRTFLNDSSTQLIGLVRTTITSSMVSLVLLALIPVYTFLILLYRHRLVIFLEFLFPSVAKEKMLEILQLTIDTYYNFIKGMAIVYLVVGMLNSLGLLLLGVPHAFLFGFIASILTFIPYVGIMVASLLPITVAWITFNSIWYPLGVVAIFAFVQYLEANLIFPLAVSQKLNLNTLFTIIAIILGGIVWGAAGMILFVPFAAILKLIAEKTEGGEALSSLLGNDDIEKKMKPPA